MTTPHLCFRSLLVGALVLAAPLAHAQPDPPPAPESSALDPVGQHMADGLRAYQAGEYGAAIASFRAAYAIDARPEILFAIAQAERKGGDCSAAVVDYTRFLSTAPPDRQAEAAREQRDRCEADLRTSPGTAIVVPPIEDEPAAPPVVAPAPPPAPHPVRVPAPAPAPPPWWHDPLADGLLGGSAALLVVGAGYAQADRKATSGANAAASYTQHAALAARAHRDGLIAATSLGAGVVVGAVAVWRIVSHRHRGTVEVVPGVGADTGAQAGLTLVGSF